MINYNTPNKMKHLTLFIVLSLTAAVCVALEDAPQVTTSLGKIKGSFKTSPNGNKYSAFEGIPYANPPIRFNNSEPVDPWPGTWDATKLYTCIQFDPVAGIIGQEDCLYINVYVPNDKPSNADNLDVIVHIHGGGFTTGSGHYYSREDFLIDRNVIFVTFNYRLGVFGFLSTEDAQSFGNFGLKDQTLALTWIKEHISNFGGNPESVTLTGLSAGAICVHYHYLSPLSKGLFHRGIAQSGTAINAYSTHKHPLETAKQFASWVGCPSEKSEEIVNCLRTRPASQLVDKQNMILATTNITALVPFGPVIEKSEKPFISEDPYAILAKGQLSNDVPLIMSNVKDEGLPFSYTYLLLAPHLDDIWTTAAPNLLLFNYTLPLDQQSAAATKIKEHYFGKDGKVEMESLPQMIKLISDRFFFYDCETAARTHAKVSKSPVYYYSFNYESEVSFLKIYGINVNISAVPHCADSPYPYSPVLAHQLLNITDLPAADKKLSSIFLDFFTSFAKTGVPTIENIDWKPVKETELNILQINDQDNLKVETVDQLADRAFWDSLNLQENQNIYKA